MKKFVGRDNSKSVACPFASSFKSESDDDSSSYISNTTKECPYARALHNNDTDESSSSADSTTIMPSSPNTLSPMWEKCPVFADHSCPFKDVKSPDDITEVMKMLPHSHIDEARPTHAVFIKTLEHFHRDQVTSIEDFSLASIMGRLARDQQHQQKQDDDDEHGSDEFQVETNIDGRTVSFPLPSTPFLVNNEPQHLRRQSRRLSEALKLGTEEAHREAESVHFVKNFIRGKIDRSLYGLFIAQLYHVYSALERALDEHAQEHFSDCHFPKELNRLTALQEDIDFWSDGDGNSLPPISPATRDYIDRIEEITKDRPILLLAHAYTRYLGDLSGGKILARVAKRALMLDSGPDGLTEGLAFYDFPLLRGSVKSFKDRYRLALNDLEFDDDVVQKIVQEANVAFLLNMRLFEELDVIGSVPQATVRPLKEVYCYAASTTLVAATSFMDAENKDKKLTAPCPFLNSRKNTTIAIPHQQEQNSTGKTCPWPFILLHDPHAGMQQWQTWLVVGVLLNFMYQYFITQSY